MKELLAVDPELWKKEIAELRRYYDEDIAAKGGRIPAALYGVLDKIEANLG
jgi:phosphoenolpyruvate carboxykinase (GTP)